eukprot:10476476-Karenia_brevis.AAC.1
MNAFDDGITSESEDDFHLLGDGALAPSPEVVQHITCKQDIAEFYSPQPVLTVAGAFGLTGCLSLDI